MADNIYMGIREELSRGTNAISIIYNHYDNIFLASYKVYKELYKEYLYVDHLIWSYTYSEAYICRPGFIAQEVGAQDAIDKCQLGLELMSFFSSRSFL